MSLYGVTKGELLSKLNEERKDLFTERDVFRSKIKISTLKLIDDIFKKGLTYYIDPSDPVSSKQESIFFRKDNFNADLSLGAKQIVNKFEEDKISFSTLAKLGDFPISRLLPVFTVNQKPKEVANELRDRLYPDYDENTRKFLKNFIEALANFNVLVFEFIEVHNKTEKANINGVFLSPNVIVLKRQKILKREVFTLAHELGHYLLNEEEIDGYSTARSTANTKESATEKWCNDFAFYFLAGNSASTIETLDMAIPSNDYHHGLIEEISKKTHLSNLALYTRLLINGRLSESNFIAIERDTFEHMERTDRAKKQQYKLDKEKALQDGKDYVGPKTPPPIVSPLYVRTLRSALYSGLINEVEFCKRLNIKPDAIDKHLS